VRDPSDIVVHINELVGLVEMKVLQADNTEVRCRAEGDRVRSICRFVTT
jgi:hypothetical protein